MGRLLLLFIIVPAVELGLLIEIGSRIGTAATIALIVVTGVVGSALARWQGVETLQRFRDQLNRGELPAGVLGDGILILLASALLITPGVLTDVVGFSLLVPPLRASIKAWLWSRIRSSVKTGNLHVRVGGFDYASQGKASAGPGYPAEDVIDLEPDDFSGPSER